jgi:hypothetical protein
MALTRKPAVKKNTIEVSASDIEWIKQTLTSVSSKIQDLDVNFTKLNQTVIGDKIYGQTGLIEKVDEHTSYIEKDKEFKSRLVGGGLVLSFLWGLVLKFWKI